MPFVQLKSAVIDTDTIGRIRKTIKVNTVYGDVYYLYVTLNLENDDGKPIKYSYYGESDRDKDYDIITKHLLDRNKIKEQPPMTDKETYGLIVPFIDQEEPFTLGFECGMVYQSIVLTGLYDGLIHFINLQQVRIIARSLKCSITTDAVQGMELEWVLVSINKIKIIKGVNQ